MKIIVISGMVVKNPSRGKPRGDYATVDLVYRVEDSVEIDDVIFYLNKAKLRAVPYDFKSGEKLDYVVGIDNDRAGDVPKRLGKKVLNRVGLSKEIKKDLQGLEWFADGASK